MRRNLQNWIGTEWHDILEGPSRTGWNVTNFRPDLKAKLWNGTDFGYVSRDGMDWNATKWDVTGWKLKWRSMQTYILNCSEIFYYFLGMLVWPCTFCSQVILKKSRLTQHRRPLPGSVLLICQNAHISHTFMVFSYIWSRWIWFVKSYGRRRQA